MQINNIALITGKCRKPCRSINFRGDNDPTGSKEKVRYKHYKQLSDNALIARSIFKAHQEVQQSGKMRMFKAIPAIATGIVATSLAIAQPGKLSAKAATGLGFLAIMAGVDALKEIIMPSKDNKEKTKAYATLGGLSAVAIGAAAWSKGAKSGTFNNVTKFISKEVNKLAEEINNTQLSKWSDKHIEPLLKKHPRFGFAAPFTTLIASCVLAPMASKGLLKGISEDLLKKTCANYEKGKIIQQIARKEFDAIDAIEV